MPLNATTKSILTWISGYVRIFFFFCRRHKAFRWCRTTDCFYNMMLRWYASAHIPLVQLKISVAHKDWNKSADSELQKMAACKIIWARNMIMKRQLDPLMALQCLALFLCLCRWKYSSRSMVLLWSRRHDTRKLFEWEIWPIRSHLTQH